MKKLIYEYLKQRFTIVLVSFLHILFYMSNENVINVYKYKRRATDVIPATTSILEPYIDKILDNEYSSCGKKMFDHHWYKT